MNIFRAKRGKVPWTLNEEGLDGSAIVTLSGELGRYHVLEKVYASFSREHTSGLLTILRGSEHPIKSYVHGMQEIQLGGGIWGIASQPLRIGLTMRGEVQPGDAATIIAIGWTDDS